MDERYSRALQAIARLMDATPEDAEVLGVLTVDYPDVLGDAAELASEGRDPSAWEVAALESRAERVDAESTAETAEPAPGTPVAEAPGQPPEDPHDRLFYGVRDFSAGLASSHHIRLRIWDPEAGKGVDPRPGRWFDGQIVAHDAAKLAHMLLGFLPDAELHILSIPKDRALHVVADTALGGHVRPSAGGLEDEPSVLPCHFDDGTWLVVDAIAGGRHQPEWLPAPFPTGLTLRGFRPGGGPGRTVEYVISPEAAAALGHAELQGEARPEVSSAKDGTTDMR